MIRWTAIVPIKEAALRKTRLAPCLSGSQRIALTDRMLHHVVDRLNESGQVEDILLLSRSRPSYDGAQWLEERGNDLNAVVHDAWRRHADRAVLFVHADLPLLSVADIAALTAIAERTGCAIAPDRHGQGTNAVALMPGSDFVFTFGPDSFRLHRQQRGVAVVDRPGLAFDIDMPADLERLHGSEIVLPLLSD